MSRMQMWEKIRRLERDLKAAKRDRDAELVRRIVGQLAQYRVS